MIGQSGFQSFQSNQGLTQPTAATLTAPVAGAFAGADLFVVDAGNHRVLVFPRQSGGAFAAANRLLGQLDFQYNSLNLIEGREFGFTGNFGSCIVNNGFPFSAGGDVVIDSLSNPPHLYIADPLNNRVLGFKDYRKVNAGSFADLVIGQPDSRTAMLNYPTNSPTQTNDQGLWSPEGLAVDSKGNLYVADTCNARVLRFPAPFSQPAGAGMQSANLVLGQTSFFGQPIQDVSSETMRSSYGLAFASDGSLMVSDPLANRILYFRKPAGADFQSGSAAANVFGQADFNSAISNLLSGPHQIALDSDDQLYVADTGNNRIAVLPNVHDAGDNPPVTFSITNVSNPFAVTVNQSTGEIWVANTSGNQLLRFPKFEQVINNPTPTATIGVAQPVAVRLDPFGDPVVGGRDQPRLVLFPRDRLHHFRQRGELFRPLRTGDAGERVCLSGRTFGSEAAKFNGLPIPTNIRRHPGSGGRCAVPRALCFLAAQINVQIPGETPVGGFEEMQVIRASTGQVLASWLFRIDAVSPALFTVDGSGQRPDRGAQSGRRR